ncbi:MAG TPA: ABC transporter ATP-binding protein [Solirubrobacteraceae bacterium]|nr:ABC transporter ATP-binding protein [Solirubrobacteraceae bacterium]
MSTVSLQEVTYTYPGADTAALSDVNLQIGAGELVVVAGGSGSGKSTLLRAISGLVPHFHGGTFAGRATIAGMDTRAHGPGELAGAVGTLFQDPETQVVMGTVRAELAFGLENRGLGPAAVARAVEEAALALGIEGLLERSTAELSGGELQRAALGAALAGRPQVVVLDEPTSQLDPVSGDELIGLLRRINEDTDATIVLAEHRLERCLGAADRVVALAGGRIVCDAAPQAFLEWAAGAAPNLQTPGAKLLGSLGLPPAAGVKRARALLRDAGLLPAPEPGSVAVHAGAPAQPRDAERPRVPARPRRLARRRAAAPACAVELRGAWHELRSGPAILRGISLTVAPGERVALMGRNGAGKSTLLRHAAGLMNPTRGTVRRGGRIALLLQNPTDYLVHDSVAEEAPPVALARAGLDPATMGSRHPRDLSGGEKQRLALAVVLGDLADRPAAVCLDEPTRGMDRDHKHQLATLLAGLDAAVIVATHDPEFASAFADRVVLLADGTVIADAAAGEILSGGSYFATETARILGGVPGVLTPADGLRLVTGAPAPSGGARVAAEAMA